MYEVNFMSYDLTEPKMNNEQVIMNSLSINFKPKKVKIKII